MLTCEELQERRKELIGAAEELEGEAKKIWLAVVDVVNERKRSGGNAIRQLAELEVKIDALKKLIRTY